jgi:hypothetical protein
MTRYHDGFSSTAVTADPSGRRIVIEGFDGKLLVHHTTYSVETAEIIAAEIATLVARIRGTAR